MTTTLPFGRSGLRRAFTLAALVPISFLGASTAWAAANCKAGVSSANQTVNEGTVVQLDGTSSTPKNGILTYSWSQTSGPSVTLSNSSSANPTFLAPQVSGPGVALGFRLTINGKAPGDCQGPDTATTVINVSNVLSNMPPVALATVSPAIVHDGNSVTLDGSTSYDPDGTAITSFLWTQTGGPAVTLLNANTSIASFVAPNTVDSNGASLTFHLQVSDGSLLGNTDKIVNVIWDNDLPVAALDCPTDANEGQMIVLDGSASNDFEGPLTYEWLQLDGPPNVPTDALTPTPSITFTAPQLGYMNSGFLPFRLKVTDAGGLTALAECTVQVHDVTAPVISGSVNQLLEATSPAGATASYSLTYTDNVDGPNPDDPLAPPNYAICDPASPQVFDLGSHTVNCSADDSSDNSTLASFTVTVQDTTAPVISNRDDEYQEASSASGAIVNYISPSTSDAYDGDGIASCEPASGTQFPFTGYLAGTLVTCNSTDSNGNVATPTTFYVFVVDTTPPTLSLPADITAEATSGAGAAVSFTATASDLVDGDVAVVCTPASGSTFALATTVVDCSATDNAGNPTSGSFNVTVVDTTPPTLSLPADISAEATSGAGAAVSFTATANDLVDSDVAVVCTPVSGSTFALATTVVDCSATDNAGNPTSGSFNVTVVDTTPPTLSLPADITAEATSGAGAAVSFTATATDIVDGSVAVNCTPASGSTFALGTTTVNCSAIDAAGNDAIGSFTVTVQDTTAPAIAFHADVNALATSASGAIVIYTLPTASDLVDGSAAVTCTPVSGGTFAVGTTAVNCSATDAAGNIGTSTFNVIVSYNFTGFFRPIDNLPTVNVVKAGQAIPVKFSLGGNMGLAIMAPGYPKSVAMVCSGSLLDAVEETVTAGGSSLSYDPTNGQYIYVWKSEKSWAGTCRQLQVKLADGSFHYANFSFTR